MSMLKIGKFVCKWSSHLVKQGGNKRHLVVGALTKSKVAQYCFDFQTVVT